jgi:predicted  nucleic acid-binding Zn-ribbon protein
MYSRVDVASFREQRVGETMHTVVKRLGGVLIMVFAALVLLSSVGGVFGIWVLKGKADRLSTAVFAPLESGLDTADQALKKVNTRVGNARDRVSNTQDLVRQLDQQPVANGAVLSAISETVGMRLEPAIDQLQASISNALGLVDGVNNSVTAINDLFGVNLPTLTNELQTLDARISTLRERIQEVRTDLAAMIQGTLQMPAGRMNSRLADLASGLQNIQEAVSKYVGNVRQIKARLTTLKSNISTAITIGSVVGTIFLLWIVISQVAMFVYGWSLLKRGTERVR